jgi:hypothetical protein
MTTEFGRVAEATGLSSTTEPEEVSALTGFDPSRIAALLPPPEEARVLDNMSEDIVYPARRLAEWTRLPERRVKEILRGFKSRGWAWYGVTYDEDEYCVSGSGYSLSPAGSEARNVIDAIAMEARRAATGNTDAVHDSADPEGIAQ